MSDSEALKQLVQLEGFNTSRLEHLVQMDLLRYWTNELAKPRYADPMFEHFKRYPWVLETYEYPSSERLIADLSKHVIGPAEKYAQSVRAATTQGGARS